MNVLKNILMRSEKNVFHNFIRSYLFIFLLPIVLFFIAYQIITTQLLEQEARRTEQSLTNKVQQLQWTMDEYFERSQAISLSILHNENMYYLLRPGTELSGSHVASTYRIANQLQSFVISNNFVSDIIVSVNEKKININQEGKITDENVYKSYIQQELGGISYQEWIKEAEGFTGGKVVCLEDGTFYFMQTYPVTPREDISKSVTLIKIRDKVLISALKGMEDINGVVTAIIDNKTGKDVLGAYQKKEFITDSLHIPNNSGYVSQDGYLFAYKKSERIPITYISAVPQSVLMEQKQDLQRIAIITFIICTVLGCGLIYYFTLRTYDPIRQLLSLAKGENSNATNLLDPYSEIKSMLLDAADQKLAYMNLHQHNNTSDKQKTFIAALYDKKSTNELICHCAEKIGISYDMNQSCFIKLKCTDISSYFEKIDDNKDLNYSPIQFCETIITKILSSNYETTSIRYGHELIFIVLLEDKILESFNRNVKENLGQAQRFLRESYGIDTIIAVSDFHSGILGLKHGFLEMNKTMEYIELTGNKIFAKYNMVPTVKYRNEFNTVLIKEEAMMLGYVKSGDFNKAKTFFNEIINNYFNDTPHSPQVLKFRLYALISNILGAMNYVNVPDVSKLIDKVNEHSDLLNCENVIEFQKRLNILFDELEEFCRTTEGEAESHFKKDVMDIVTGNYMNPDLNVSMIANMLNKNLDYVSRTFKKMTGNGLLDYIHELRITKAKNYLHENQELSIQQVSSMVGYISCESFIRVFKRREGVTPGRYKAMLEDPNNICKKINKKR